MYSVKKGNKFVILPMNYLEHLSDEDFVDLFKGHFLMESDCEKIEPTREYIISLSNKEFVIFAKEFLKNLNETDFKNFSKNAILFAKGRGYTYFAREYLESLNDKERVTANIYNIRRRFSNLEYEKIENFLTNGLIDGDKLFYSGYTEEQVKMIKSENLSLEEAEERLNYSDEYYFNPKIIDQIYENYILMRHYYIEGVEYEDIKDLKAILNFATTNEEIKDILKIKKLELWNNLINNFSCSDYFERHDKKSIYKEKNIFDDEFIEHFKKRISSEEQLIEDFLCDGYTPENLDFFGDEDKKKYDLFVSNDLGQDEDDYDIYNYSLFKLVLNMERTFQILEFIKEYEINNNLITNKISMTNENKIKDKYYSNVFIGQDEENAFFEMLDTLNAFNEDRSPKKRYFNPLCDAIFNSYEEFKKEIFKHNLKKSEYVAYLKHIYPNEFKNHRLSDGFVHIEAINEKFPEIIKILKQKKLDQKQQERTSTTK